MNPDSENSFLDTNILVYAYDETAGQKHSTAKQMVLECMQGEATFVISNQILGELVNTARNKLPSISRTEIQALMEEILGLPSWIKVNYTEQTSWKALADLNSEDDFWDAVIAQTMKENGITTIYTENVKDFQKIKGIKAVNPFRKN